MKTCYNHVPTLIFNKIYNYYDIMYHNETYTHSAPIIHLVDLGETFFDRGSYLEISKQMGWSRLGCTGLSICVVLY